MATKLKAQPPELTNPGHTKMMVFGASGVGKSWFALDMPKPYYIDCEGGARLKHYQDKLAKAGGVYLSPEDGALDFNFLIEQVQALATEKHEFRTLVVDSVTKVYQSCIAHEAERLGDKDAFGASKKPAVANMRRLIAWIMRLDMNVVFIAHETAEWGVDSKGVRTEIGKVADVWDKLQFELDLVLQAVKRGSSRYAVVRKSRLMGFPDLEQFPLAYADFAERYGKDYIEAEAKPIVLATPEQVAEIERLLGIVKVDQPTIDKWYTKAGAEDFREFNTDQAQGIIDFLTKKVSK